VVSMLCFDTTSFVKALRTATYCIRGGRYFAGSRHERIVTLMTPVRQIYGSTDGLAGGGSQYINTDASSQMDGIGECLQVHIIYDR
jgi:hypothetical protein